jgi:hypothetical protein
MLLETVAATVTMASTAAEANMAAVDDGSLTVRSFPSGSPAYLLNLWGQQATAGYTEVKSPRLHDNVRGIRARIGATTPYAELPIETRQLVYAQDTLTVANLGGNSEVDDAGLLFYYSDIPGLDARLSTWDQVLARLVNVLTVDLTMTAPATAGHWGAGVALSASSGADLLKANTDYAILGYATDTACTSVAIKGPDTGNVRAGGPGTVDPRHTRGFFVDLSKALGLPAIPVINSANKDATNVAQANNAASGTPQIVLNLAELRVG